MAQQFSNSATQKLPQACIVDLTAPTFAGIATLVANANGSLTAGWLAATEAVSNPVSYEVYIQAASATGLFNVANIAQISRTLSATIFALSNGQVLQQGVTYFVGVRAVDAIGNRDSNLVSLSRVSNGVLTSDLATVANTLNALLTGLGGGLQGTVDDSESIAGVVDDATNVVGVVEEC